MPPEEPSEYYENIWDAVVSDNTLDDIQERTGYSEQEALDKQYDIFADMVPDDFNERQAEQMWGDYLEAFVQGGGSMDDFFEEYDIDPEDFDWEAWREAMGY